MAISFSPAVLLASALPSLRESVAGSAVWAAGMALTAVVSLWMRGWTTPHSILLIGVIFAGGGALAFAPALFVARLVSAGRRREVRLAAGLLSFSAITLSVTGLIYGIQSWAVSLEAQAGLFSVDGLRDLVYVNISALFSFALFGAPLYFPLGLLFLFAAGLWHMRRSR